MFVNNYRVFVNIYSTHNMNIIQNENLTNQTQHDFSLSSSNYAFNIHNIVFIPEYGNYVFIIDEII